MSINPRLRSLDGVRGCAVSFVFLSHASQRGAGPVEWLRFDGLGHVGVYLFFSLSAFLLATRLASGQPLAAYFINRFFRIAPLYYVVVVGTYCQQQFFPANELSLFLNGGVKGLIETFLFYRGDGIFWTIPVEMAFYVLLPILCFVGRCKFGRILLITAAVVYFSWYYSIQAFHAALPHPHFLRVAHVGHFLDVFIMAVVATLARTPGATEMVSVNSITSWGAYLFLGLLAMTVVLVSQNFLGFHQPWKNLRELSLLYAVIFALGLHTVVHGSKALDWLFDRLFLRQLGRYSFGIYLLHMPVIMASVALVPELIPGLRFLFAVVGTLAIARLAHRYIELPGIVLGQHLASHTSILVKDRPDGYHR